MTVTQGLHEIMIIAGKKNEAKITAHFKKNQIKKVIRRLSALIINISEESVQTIGLFFLLSRALNWHKINIIDIVSTFTEMTFIVDENDTAGGFNVLKKVIAENQ